LIVASGVYLPATNDDIAFSIVRPPPAISIFTGLLVRRPSVILIIGVNGSGKTTTVGKLSHKFKSAGLNVLLAAGDTFRAAAAEQLTEWSNRSSATMGDFRSLTLRLSSPCASGVCSCCVGSRYSGNTFGLNQLCNVVSEGMKPEEVLSVAVKQAVEDGTTDIVICDTSGALPANSSAVLCCLIAAPANNECEACVLSQGGFITTSA
jgi:signal recognition particle GTPase